MKRAIALLAAGAAFCAASLSAEARNIELKDWLDWETAQNANISPDGGSIIYTRSRVDKFTDKMDPEIWTMSANGTRHRFLIKGSQAQWSPAGDRIAFITQDGDKSQLFTRFMDAEGAVSQITHDEFQPNIFSWSPDGKWFAIRAMTPMEPEFKIKLPARPKGATWTDDPPVIETLHYRTDQVGPKTGFNHIFIVPAEGGAPRQITSGRWDVGAKFSGIDQGNPLEWTPDGRSIVFDGLTDPAMEREFARSDINIVSLSGGAPRKLQPTPGNWSNPRVSPNGRMIAYTGHQIRAATYPNQELRVMNIDGSGDRILVADLPADLSNLEWSSSNDGLYYAVDHEGSRNVHFVNLSGSSRQVTRGQHRITLGSIARNGAAAVTVQSPSVSLNVARVDLGRGTLSQLTDLNADVLEGVDLGETEEFWYDSSNGTRVQGWLVKPPGFQPNRKYPLMLAIHGGPHAMYGVDFHFPFKEHAANGYLVLYTNPRGSTGYGGAFANAIDNQYPGQPDYDDLMNGVDAVLARGIVDESKLFVYGCSGGGILTEWIVTHTDRFSAAAALCPVTNWISFSGQGDVSGWIHSMFRPHFSEDPSRWLEHSPIMHVKNVKTPTLLMTGDRDLRTPIEQAEEFYSALVYRGVPTKLVRMRGEWHGTSSIPSNMLRTQLYIRKWFSMYGGVPVSEDTGEAAIAAN